MNKMEQLRIDRMRPWGCVACAYVAIVTPSEELHHLLMGGRRIGDWFTIFMCRGHHQGDHWHEHIPMGYRVSLKQGSIAFADAITTERVLWDRVQERLGLSWPESKIVERIQFFSPENPV